MKKTIVATLATMTGVLSATLLSGGAATAISLDSTVIPFVSDNDVFYSDVSTGGSHIAYSYYEANQVWILDTAAGTITEIDDTVQIFDGPADVVFSPDGSVLYVANYDGGNLLIVDVATGAVTEQLFSDDLEEPNTIEISPDGTMLYVGDYSNDSLLTYDLVTDATVSYASVIRPYSMQISADGGSVFNIDRYGQIDVFDTATSSVTSSWMSVTGVFRDTCVNADSTILYMPDREGGYLYKVSLSDGSIIDSLDLATVSDVTNTHTTCAVSPDGSRVFLTDYDNGDTTGAPDFAVTEAGLVTEFTASPLGYLTFHDISGVAYTEQINFYSPCSGYIAGFYGNAQKFTLDEGACGPTLADTGINATAAVATAVLATVALAAGAVVLTVRRRQAKATLR